MTKNKWLVLAIILVCAALFLTIFGFTFKSQTGVPLPWWAYIAALVIFALIVYLIVVLSERSTQRFQSTLIKNGISTDKQYKWGRYLLYVDFDSQLLANNYMATRAIIPFSEVAGYRIESYRSGEEEELSEEETYLSLVITLKKPGFEYEYQYIPVFEIKVKADDATDIKEITAELAEKYPELADMLELQGDLRQILEINEANGIRSNVRKD